MPNNRSVDKKASVPARFPQHFDRHVTPRLAELIQWSGNLVACEAYSFGEVMSLLWREAYKLGCGYLADDVQDELRDWLLTELSASILADPPPGALSPSAAFKLWASLGHVTAPEIESGDSNGQ